MLSKKQFGFRQNTSTNDAIAYLTNKIYQSIDSSTPSACVFIDLAKAFDTISHKRVLEKLEDFGVRGICHKLFRDYLKNRTQYVNIDNNFSEPKTVLCGLPQGTVLAPIMFIIYLNDILTLDIKGSIISFADDTAIYFTGNSWEEVRHTVEVDLKVIKDWFDENLLTININKTTYLPFCSYTNKLPSFSEICISNTNLKIQSSQKIKYLGIIIDCHLKWDCHITELVKKLRSLLYKFTTIKNILKAKKPLKAIYYGMIESLLKYGIIGWGGANKFNIKPLIQVQKRFLKIMYERSYRYPTDLLFNESEVLHIRQIYSETILNYHYKHFDRNQIIDHRYDTRHRAEQNIKVSVAQKTIGMKNYSYLAPRLFNIIPENIKNITYFKRFKYEIRKWLLKQDYKQIERLIDTGCL